MASYLCELMLLKIQSGESIRSYIGRNLHLNWGNSTYDSFSRFTQCYFSASDLQEIASISGLNGEDGFRYLLHNHVDFKPTSIFKPVGEMMLQNYNSVARATVVGASWDGERYCPKCAQEDVVRLGFSYWRRSLEHAPKICPKHNVVLIDRCPHCLQKFCSEGHGPEVLWAKCDGRSLVDVAAQAGRDPQELRRARHYHDMSVFKYVVSEDDALDVVGSKFEKLGTSDNMDIGGLGWSLYRTFARRENKYNKVSISHAWLIADAVVELYDSFACFADELKAMGVQSRPIHSSLINRN